MNGVFIPAKYDEYAKTEIEYKGWKIVLDYYSNYGSNDSRVMYFNRVITKFETLDGFRFEIYNNGLIRSIEKLFGAQDIKIGVSDFDKKFIIKSNNGFKIKRLLQNSEIRSILNSLKEVNFETSNKQGIWGKQLPEKELELSFYTERMIKNTDELKTLLRLFQLILDDLFESKLIK